MDRDPVSVELDPHARRLLERAYADPGSWKQTRLGLPGPRLRAWAAARGIDLTGPDDVSARGGRGLNAHTRYARAFVRSLYYQHRWYSQGGGAGWRQQRRTAPRQGGGIEVQVGRMQPALGALPAGRLVRVRLHTGGPDAKAAHFASLPDTRRAYDPAGEPGARWSDPARRDW